MFAHVQQQQQQQQQSSHGVGWHVWVVLCFFNVHTKLLTHSS
jgi:hypothetical protein